MKQGWEIKTLGEVFDLQMGKTPSRDNGDYWGGDNVWVAISDLQDKYIGESKEHITDKALTETKIKKVKAGTTIMSFKLSVGRAAITTQDLYTNEAIMAFNLNEGYDLIADYIYYYLKGYKWQGANKAVMGLTLNKASISQNHIAIPPREEQERIVAELDCLSGVIEKKREQLRELDALAQSIFYQIFGDPITNEKGWEVKKLGEIATSQIGITYKPENVSDNDEGTIVLRSSNIQESALCFDDIVRVKCDIKANKYVQDGDILMCSRNGSFRLVGKVAMIANLPEPMTYGAFMTIIRSPYQAYLFAFFKTSAFRSQLTTSQTATINQITVKMLDEIKVALPPMDLQQEFADKIEAIEKQKTLIKQSITQTEELFNARMDYYFN